MHAHASIFARYASVLGALALTCACGGSVSSNSQGTGGAPGAGGTAGSAGASGAAGSGGAGHFVCNGKTMEAPTHHRTAGITCPTNPPESCDGGVGPGCGPHCMSDGDCASGSTCSCDGTAFGWSHQSLGNVCLPSNCRTDADCPSGYCSPSDGFDSGPFYGIAGYYCHTCADTCVNDSDCTSPGGYCAYQSTVGHWACSYSAAAG